MKSTYLFLTAITNKIINEKSNNTLTLRRTGSNDVVCTSKKSYKKAKQNTSKTKTKQNKQTNNPPPQKKMVLTGNIHLNANYFIE